MPLVIPGWLPIAAAAERAGTSVYTIRKMVADEILTRGRFTSVAPGAPIYIRIDELDAWKIDGLEGVRRVQEANRAAKSELAAAHAPDLGESGA